MSDQLPENLDMRSIDTEQEEAFFALPPCVVIRLDPKAGYESWEVRQILSNSTNTRGCYPSLETALPDATEMAKAIRAQHSLDAPHVAMAVPDYSAPAFLEKGAKHMRDRAELRDAPDGEKSMGRTVAAFNELYGKNLTEEEGWMFMVLLKQSRSSQGKFTPDDYEDGAAYFGLAGEAAAKERQPQ